jgi:hypothetical protein
LIAKAVDAPNNPVAAIIDRNPLVNTLVGLMVPFLSKIERIG